MSRHVLPAIALLLTASSVRAQSPAQTPELLTIERAVDIAIDQNRDVRNAAVDVERTRDETAVTKTRRWPAMKVNLLESMLLSQIDFTFPPGALGTYPTIGPIPDTDRTITTPRRPNTLLYSTVSQPLSQLYQIRLGVKLNELKTDAASEALRSTRQNVANDVTRLYYAIVQSQSTLAAAEESVTFYRELRRTTGDLVAQRVALRGDALDVDSRLASAEYTVLTVGNALASQKEQLNTLLGRDVNSEFRVVTVSEPRDLDVNVAEARTRALAQRPEIRQARLRVRMAEDDRRVKRAEYIPEVSLMFTYVSPFGIAFVPRNIATIGVMGSWEPFDWGRRTRELTEKGRVIEQARTTLIETETRVIVDVNAKLRQLQEAGALVKVARAERDAQSERVRVARDRYSLRAALLKDVLEVATRQADAERAYQQAIARFWSAQGDFGHALGENVR